MNMTTLNELVDLGNGDKEDYKTKTCIFYDVINGGTELYLIISSGTLPSLVLGGGALSSLILNSGGFLSQVRCGGQAWWLLRRTSMQKLLLQQILAT